LISGVGSACVGNGTARARTGRRRATAASSHPQGTRNRDGDAHHALNVVIRARRYCRAASTGGDAPPTSMRRQHQLSWWRRVDSNHLPTDYESNEPSGRPQTRALVTE
jgi:hypothetical protein